MKLPATAADPLFHLREAMSRWEGSSQVTSLKLKEVTVTEIIAMIKDLNSSKSFGHEGIDSTP